MVELAANIWADGPSSNPYEPSKAQIRSWGTWVEGIISAFTSNGGLIFTLKSNMDAVLTHAPATMAWLVGDPVTANNGIYQKLGASGSGSWVRRADLPYSFIIASDAGAGTANDILATTSIPVSASALVWMNVAETNTASPVSVSFNGDPALIIKTNSGNNIVAGGLVAGTIVLGIVSGTTFRLVSDQASAAIVAAAEAAADRAEDAAVGLERMPVLPETFGALHNGTNDKAAIEAAAAFAVAHDRPLQLSVGRTYTFSTLSLPDDLQIVGEGVLRHDGSIIAGDIAALGAGTSAEAIKLSFPAHGNGIYDLRIGVRSRIAYVETIADSQSQGETVVTTGQDVWIGMHKAVNCDRPLHVDNSLGVALTSGFKLDFYDWTSYLRCGRLTATTRYNIGFGNVRGRSPNAINESPGYNVWLLTSAPNGKIAGGVWEDSGEHTFRVGGNIGPGLVDTSDVDVGDIVVKRCSASPIKINPTYQYRAKRITFGDILVVDGGFTTGTTAKRSDGLRASHCEDISIRSMRFVTEQLPTSCEVAIRLNNAKNIRVGYVDARFVESALFAIDETADVDVGQGATQSGDVTGVYIDRFVGVKGAGTYPFSFSLPNHNIADIHINGMDVSGLTNGLASFGSPTNITGVIELTGAVQGTSALSFSNLPSNDLVKLDLMVNDGARFIGSARQMAVNTATLTVGSQPFTLDASTQLGAVFAQTQTGTAALGAYSTGYLASRAGPSGRRGVGWVGKQTGANAQDMGFTIVVNGATVGGDDVLVEGPTIDHLGNIVPDTPDTKSIGSSALKWLGYFRTVFFGPSTAILTSNAGTPEAVVSAPIGSICTDTTNGVAYMKKTGTGNTGWKLVTQAV
ncbi:hypothetical protein ACI2KT_18890 [Ensifer adhaerens]|uniref:hypothetical protein n=1 Tax=Ensifer adhaerens TaxID=106592 RepID=UPI0038500BCF